MQRVNGITPWCRLSEAENAFHSRTLDYQRAVREGVGIVAACTAMLAGMRMFEEVTAREAITANLAR